LQPPILAKLSASGWSGSARFGARYWTRMLFWANRGHISLTRTYADLVAPITPHRHHQNHFWWPIYHPYSTNQPICDLQHNRIAARSNWGCAGSAVESSLPLLPLLLLSHPHAGSLLTAYCLLPVCGRTAHRSILGRKGALLHAHCRQTMRTLSKPIWVWPQPPRGGTADRQRYNILTTRTPTRPRSVDFVSGATSGTDQRSVLVADPLWAIPETWRGHGLTPVACRPADPASRPVDLHAKQQKSLQLWIILTRVSW